jgi:hypothetical protein
MTTPTEPTAHPAEALYQAVASARYAPSAGNAQPWRWRLAGDVLDLFVENSRMTDVADPAGRLAAISCGAALHHARLALAAQGWRISTTRHPDQADPRHLARLVAVRAEPSAADDARQAHAIRERHTDHRPVTGSPLRPKDLAAITAAFGAEAPAVAVHVLRSDEILSLVVATEPAGDVEPDEAQWRDELTRWAGRGRSAARAATFAVLHGPADRHADWLRAGEALSAGWLTATDLGVSVLPLSAPIERPAARDAMQRVLDDLGSTYLVVRLGQHATDSVAPYTHRLPVDQILDRPAA